jgi:hypothetical protein
VLNSLRIPTKCSIPIHVFVPKEPTIDTVPRHMADSCKLLFSSSSYCIGVFVLFSLVLELISKWALIPHFVDMRIGGQDAWTWMIVSLLEVVRGWGAYVTFSCPMGMLWLTGLMLPGPWMGASSLPFLIILVLQAYMAMAEGSHPTVS